MRSLLRKLSPVFCAVIAALALSACGDSHSKVTTGTYAGESGQNAPYLDVGPLIYEVQLSRELNPANTEDAAYLKGLSAEQSKLEPGQEWFAVFMQVYNIESTPHPASSLLSISDTNGTTYSPVVPEQTNEFAYRGGTVQPKEKLPPPDTTADFGPTQGSLLLFKIKLESLDNRPLVLKIVAPEGSAETASAELDV
jgi:hypothetical protein